MKTELDVFNDDPPMSRIFIICGKSTTEAMIREEFSVFGIIEKLWIVKDRNTNESKGIAYIKYSRTSDAAAALEEMNGKVISNEERPIKVFVASSRSSGVLKKEKDEERYLRLFIVINKSTTRGELLKDFEAYGEIESIVIPKNKVTRESKGVAYVKFKKFLGAALAFERASSKYKAVFATPRPKEDGDNKIEMPTKRPRIEENLREKIRLIKNEHIDGSFNKSTNMFKTQYDESHSTTLEVIASNSLNQDQLWRLFDIIPGLDYCQIINESGPKNQNVTVVYTNLDSAKYAKEKIHGLEFPPGERLIVRLPSTDCNKKILDNKGSKDWFCSVHLQPAKPILSLDTPCLARCFIVLSSSIPVPILKNVFCTFGFLIDVYLLHNKNCGYVKYGNIQSAESAINTLNEAEICGVKIKVMVADAPKESNKRIN